MLYASSAAHKRPLPLDSRPSPFYVHRRNHAMATMRAPVFSPLINWYQRLPAHTTLITTGMHFIPQGARCIIQTVPLQAVLTTKSNSKMNVLEMVLYHPSSHNRLREADKIKKHLRMKRRGRVWVMLIELMQLICCYGREGLCKLCIINRGSSPIISHLENGPITQFQCTGSFIGVYVICL